MLIDGVVGIVITVLTICSCVGGSFTSYRKSMNARGARRILSSDVVVGGVLTIFQSLSLMSVDRMYRAKRS